MSSNSIINYCEKLLIHIKKIFVMQWILTVMLMQGL